MLDGQPELPVMEVYVALSRTDKGNRVAFGSLGLGYGEKKILSKSFTVFRSPRTGGLYVSWPTYDQMVDGKKVYKDVDVWIDIDEAKYWAARIIEETNRHLGVATVANSGKPKSSSVESTPADAEPAKPAEPKRRVGWAGQKK